MNALFHIKINTSEDNMDKGFYALMTSGASIVCVDKDEYVVPANAVEKLNEKKVIYEVVTQKKGESKKEDCNQNATET